MEEYSIKIERNGYTNILQIKADVEDLVIKQIVKDIYMKIGESVDVSGED